MLPRVSQKYKLGITPCSCRRLASLDTISGPGPSIMAAADMKTTHPKPETSSCFSQIIVTRHDDCRRRQAFPDMEHDSPREVAGSAALEAACSYQWSLGNVG